VILAKPRTPAVAYLRTSSAANVGADKNSDKRQHAAIQGYAKRDGFEFVAEYYDGQPAMSAARIAAYLRKTFGTPGVSDIR
jgi:hypothetical protein